MIITITHIKRDSDCNGNEKDSSEKQMEQKSQKSNLKNKQTILGNLQREQGKGRDKIKLKKTTITTKKRNRILNKIKNLLTFPLRLFFTVLFFISVAVAVSFYMCHY